MSVDPSRYLRTPRYRYTAILHSFDVVLAIEVIEHLLSPKKWQKMQKKPHFWREANYLYPYDGYLNNLVLAVCGKPDKHFTVFWDNGNIIFVTREADRFISI
ncbi:hypothetical protein QUA56_31805 [Microcoleus sp. N3A4]|uniref:hypothetical protein n=1 Tax=Microcoleus sp. N3A4 TaxID=3055379 RepID=UPI002FD2F23B